MAAYQAPPSLGFSGQEHWSGLPLPSPMHERKSESEVPQSCPTLCDPWTAAYQAPLSMGFSRREYWSGLPLPSPSESKSCSIMSNTLQPHGPYSPWNSPGQNTGVGGLSLLLGLFPTQGSNPCFPHCRRILCQLSHKLTLKTPIPCLCLQELTGEIGVIRREFLPP